MLSYTDLRKPMIVESLANDINSLAGQSVTVSGFTYTVHPRTQALQFQRSNTKDKQDRYIGLVPEWDADTYHAIREKLDGLGVSNHV